MDWDSLAPLRDVILSGSDVRAIDTPWLEKGKEQEGVDKTDELGDSCLRDCAKSLFPTEKGLLTIILIRAGSSEKAIRTSASLRNDYLAGAITEYAMGELPDMPEKSWVIAHRGAGSYYVDSVVGVPAGAVVILIALQQQMCFEGDEGLRCEGDLYSPSWLVVEYANRQIKKLLEAGYTL